MQRSLGPLDRGVNGCGGFAFPFLQHSTATSTVCTRLVMKHPTRVSHQERSTTFLTVPHITLLDDQLCENIVDRTQQRGRCHDESPTGKGIRKIIKIEYSLNYRANASAARVELLSNDSTNIIKQLIGITCRGSVIEATGLDRPFMNRTQKLNRLNIATHCFSQMNIQINDHRHAANRLSPFRQGFLANLTDATAMPQQSICLGKRGNFLWQPSSCQVKYHLRIPLNLIPGCCFNSDHRVFNPRGATTPSGSLIRLQRLLPFVWRICRVTPSIGVYPLQVNGYDATLCMSKGDARDRRTHQHRCRNDR